MTRKLIHLALVTGIAIGGFLAWRTSQERDRLEQRYRLLIQTTGELLVTDPSRPLFRALNTGEPLHYAWRIYLPPGYEQKLRDRFGSGNTSYSSSSVEMIARVRFRENATGGLDLYLNFSGGSSRSTIAEKPLVDLMRGRWSELKVEQIGKEPTSIDPKKPTVLLRLTFPPSLQEELKAKLPFFDQSRYLPVFYELTLDPASP